MKKNIFEGWLEEATSGFAGTEIDLHGFGSIAEYVESYFDGMGYYISTKEAARLSGLYENYRRSVLQNGQFSAAYNRMINAVENE